VATGDEQTVVLPISGAMVTQLRIDHRLSLLFESGGELSLSGSATLRSSSQPVRVEPEGHANVLTALDLLWDTVTRAEASPTGLLTTEFSKGPTLTIDADSDYEAWEFVTVDGEQRVVCLPGGGLATWGFDAHLPTVGAAKHHDEMSECCFCSRPVDPDQRGSLTLVVAAAGRQNEPDRPTQQLRCHGPCLGGRFAGRVPFDLDAFAD
jgi:hypothetical protein